MPTKIITADDLLNKLAEQGGYDKEYTLGELEAALEQMKGANQ